MEAATSRTRAMVLVAIDALQKMLGVVVDGGVVDGGDDGRDGKQEAGKK